MLFLLTAETLPVDQLLQHSQPSMVKQGRELHRQGYAQVQQATGASAVIIVAQPGQPEQRVAVGMSGNQVFLTCGCRMGYGWGLCQHRVAALLALRDHLREHPPAIWRAVLDRAVQQPARRQGGFVGVNVIVFSLQQRGQSWVIVPYSMSGRSLPADHQGDPDRIAEAIAQQDLGVQLRTLRSQVDPAGYPTMGLTAIAAANTAIAAGGGYGYWHTGGRTFITVLAMLPGCLVYLGDEHSPLSGGRVFVHEQPATVELEVSRGPEMLEATFQVALDGRPLTLRPGHSRLIARDPTWILADDQIFRIAEGGLDPDLLTNYARLRIPISEETEFLDRYLLPLSEQVPVRGDFVQWEDVAVAPEPRVYLSERSSELVAELRFGYAGFELPFEKQMPSESLRRRPGSPTFVRIKRAPEVEQEAQQTLASGNGLKKGGGPHEFTLRKNVAPADFLLREVPKLAAAGFAVFGEEALTLARVNRSRPTIAFNVSSGLDWFDVEAVVSFGDQLLPLKELKRALKRRERYVKLADGSLGAIPEEWAARYKHLFAFGEEREESLRLSSHHLSLLDEVLAEADRAQTDDAYAERRERLRSFERVEPQALPAGFVGELRPYQKAGYDWLHFLRRYQFGGCLADDMGTGKCVAADTRIFINGALKTAESIWASYAGATSFDGEGEWAEPAAPLLVNALDEQSGRIVGARVQRLYRQHVTERLRRVRLEDGSTITITARHRLLGRDGWTTDFKPGDYICVPAHLIWQGEEVDPDLVTLLAWQIAEGYEMNDRATVTITQKETAKLDELLELFHRLADRYELQLNRPAIVASPGKAPGLRLTSAAYRHFLVARGYSWGLLSAEKRIPDFIMQADLPSIRLFLRHFFDAEGSVMTGGRGVELSSASRELIEQVAMLLRRCGIWFRIHPKQKCATNGRRIIRTYYNGLISGTSARRFAEQIGFGDPRKQQRLEALAMLPTNTNSEGVPVSDIVSSLVHTTGLPVRHLGMHNTVYINGSQQFSRVSLGRVIGQLDSILSGESALAYQASPRTKWSERTLQAYAELDHALVRQQRNRLEQLMSREVHFCRIAAVEEVEYDGWVYDLEIAEHHNFVAEQMLCHNTIQALAFLQSLYEEQPRPGASLLVMPRSLLFNWQREAAQFAPGLRVYVHADQGRISEAAQFAQHDLVLTTYGVMLRDIELLRAYNFHYAILDESQAIKNPLAATSRAARALRAEHRLVLTGTPVENSTLELWSQFAFLNPGLLGNLDYFREEFAGPIERKQDIESATFLRKMVYPFILRRTKDQVALDLPPRSEELLVTEMEPAQRKLYIKTRDYYRAMLLGMIDDEGLGDARMKILEGLLRLRQICNHPRLVDAKFRGSSAKFELLLETLDTLRAEGHKALIFSQFVQMLSIIREALDERKIAYAYLDGSTRNRQEVVDRFQNNPKLPFFLISLKAGGVGLNLTAADYVIHVDPWWNPAVEMQATDRTHRIGQTRPVFVYKLITRDTVEEKILKLQEQKRALVAQLISSEGGVFKSLTRDDVEVLFS